VGIRVTRVCDSSTTISTKPFITYITIQTPNILAVDVLETGIFD